MGIISTLQPLYDVLAGPKHLMGSKYSREKSLTGVTFYAAATGYMVGCVVRWIQPSAPILPLGCATAAISWIPVGCGCALIVGKIVHLIHEKSAAYAAGFAFFLGGATWGVLGSLAFSAKPTLPPIILTLTFTITLIVDFIFG